MVILTLNCGSSSAKYQVYDWDNKEVMANGVVERIGIEGSCITHKAKGKKTEIESPCPTHKEAIELIIKEITDPEVGVIKSMDEIGAVGHRVLHGGEKFTKSILITPEVLDGFREVVDLGPLHMPANIMGIEAAQKVMPNIPHSAIMDTAWHQTMPEETFQWIQHGTRQCRKKLSSTQFHANGTRSMLPAVTVSTEHLSFTQQNVLQFSLEKIQKTATLLSATLETVLLCVLLRTAFATIQQWVLLLSKVL